MCVEMKRELNVILKTKISIKMVILHSRNYSHTNTHLPGTGPAVGLHKLSSKLIYSSRRSNIQTLNHKQGYNIYQ